ncbi:hypothetical protein, partial [Phocaeicola vulgatus]|uniref:hypothetical protein n=1 Tax=Phocaeicola vulgatus TaxID=821 RepID=UPI00321B6D37
MNIAGMEAALFFVEKRWRNFHKLSVPTVAGTCKENVHGKRIRRCVKMRTFFFYAQSPDFHKQGLCY